MTYERAFGAQADLRIVRGSTIERKQMSTTIKRVALVAVAALGLGVVSVAPSTAAQSAAQTIIYCSQADGGAISNTTTTGATCGGIAGSSNFVTLTGVQTAKDVELTVTGSTFVTQSGSTYVTNAAGTVALAAAANANTTIKVATPTAGTITISVKTSTAGSGIYTASTETVVITVASVALSSTYNAAKSPIYIVAGETHTASADATTTPTKVKTYVGTDSATASIVALNLDGLGVAVQTDTLTATITSGPGTIKTAVTAATGVFDSVTAYNLQSSATLGTYSASARPDSQGKVAFYVFANGQVGESTIVVKNAAGTVLSTKKVLFTDTVVGSITVTVLKPTVSGDATTPTTNAIKLTLKDSAGNAMTSVGTYPTAKSSDAVLADASQTGSAGVADTATVNASGEVFWGITPAAAAKYGKVTITFTAGTVTATADVILSSAKASTFTIASSSVTAGAAVDHVITALDANGYAVPEGSLLSNYVSARTTTGGIATDTDITTANKSVKGVWTVSGVAPLASTTLKTTYTLTGTAATADTNFVATLAGTKPVVETAVSNPSADAATDAANEATDAANAATDAALAAAEAADAATSAAQEASDAVAALSESVTKLIAGLQAQIKSLAAVVAKIAKKVKA
jgi:hypothetical protein